MRSRLELVLHNATVAVADGLGAVDIGIAGGRIAAIEPAGASPRRAAREIDLAGKLVLPGLIDPHVHFREPGAHAYKGGYPSESQAAAAGGVTTVLTMPNTVPFTGTLAALRRARAAARGRTAVDYGFHFGVQAGHLAALRAVRNVPAFKLYLNETTGITTPLWDEELLAKVFRIGHPVVAHAEADTLDNLLAVHARYGLGPLYVAHLSLAREVAALRAAKARGQWVYGEVTPHHLLLCAEDLDRLGPLADMRPTLKSRADTLALWQGLRDGTIDCIGSDHAPHLRSEKSGPHPPPGVPGVQTMLPLLLTLVADGALSPADLVRLTSRNAARIFALANKGELRVGADADLAIVDPRREHTIRDESQLTRPGWTPFHGAVCRGLVTMTILRGTVIYQAGRIVVPDAGRPVLTRSPGRFLGGSTVAAEKPGRHGRGRVT